MIPDTITSMRQQVPNILDKKPFLSSIQGKPAKVRPTGPTYIFAGT